MPARRDAVALRPFAAGGDRRNHRQPHLDPQSLGQAIANMLIFAALGIAAAVIGYKILDKCTPGDLTKEILENKNIAAAIVAAAVILGVCLIVAAAMIG